MKFMKNLCQFVGLALRQRKPAFRPLMDMLRRVMAFLCALTVLLPAHADAPPNGWTVTVPNGYANLAADDLQVATTAGTVRWIRVWDGQEWKFNPQWESLSQSWKNMTGSQTADTTSGTTVGTAAPTYSNSGGVTNDGGCWVWVDENWTPSVGDTTIGGAPAAAPMVPIRTTPFNRFMGETTGDYPPPERVSVDYASLCAGSSYSGSAVVRQVEGIRRANELYLGEEGRYAFSNRAVLEKRSVRQLPAASAAALYANMAGGAIALAPVTNAKGFRWMDKGGDWIDYDTQGLVVAWGDKNDNMVWMLRDSGGVLRGIVDANGRVVYSLHYTGELITEIRDYAAGVGAQAHSVKYAYDANNRLSQVIDARGFATTYDYNVSNHIVKVTDPEGRIDQFTYNGDTVKKRTAPDGAVTDYAFDYDDTNKQFSSKITGPETAAGRRVENYTHNRVGKLTRALINGRTDMEVRYDTGARTRLETNARGFTTRITSNEFDQVVDISLPDGNVRTRAYSAVNLELTETTDELGIRTSYEYDAKGNVVRLVEAAGTVDQRVTEYLRNAIGQIALSTRKGGTEINGTVTPDAVWKREYDPLGQLNRTVDPEGAVRQYRYDQAGNLLAYTDPLGNENRYEVDANGNLVKMTDALDRTRQYKYDMVGNLVTLTDARAKVVQATYDAMNRHLQTINAVGGVYKIQYNGLGLPISETDEDGKTSLAEFDTFMRMTRQIDGMGNITQFAYTVPDGSDAGATGSLFEPTEVRYPTFTHRQRFDQLERPTSDTTLNPNSLGTEGLVSSTSYDKRGQVQSETNPNGKAAFYTYDSLGQLSEITDSLGNKTKALYDLRGNLIQITDAKGNVNKFEFDRNDNVIREILPLGQVTAYQYDAAGNMIERSNPNGTKVMFVYDAGDRVTEVRQYLAGGVLAHTTTYTWDSEANLTSWSDIDHVAGQNAGSSISYDDVSRKTREVVSYPDGSTMSYSYVYSKSGNKTALTWPDGTVIGYDYSAHDELASVTIPGEGTIDVTQFKWLAPAKVVLPGGTTQERTYDGLLNLESLRVKSPNQVTMMSVANTFGKVQELKSASRTDTGNSGSTTTSKSYRYDDEVRLVETTTDRGSVFGTDTENFTLDALGNRIAHSRVSGAWNYDANNRLIQRGTGTNATNYEYDQAGNLTRKVEPGNKISLYQYDSQNRLIRVRDGNNQLVARYLYDPLDRRLVREQYRDKGGEVLVPAKRTLYLYADEGLIAETTQSIALGQDDAVTANGSAVITAQYGPRPNADFTSEALFAKVFNSNNQAIFAYYHQDQIGTPIQATDKSGRVVWAATYDSFGRASITTPAATADAPTITSNLRLPGQIEDPETGLHYNFRRYYDPSTGRYITQDPIGLEGGNNSYRYAQADPVNLKDPTGECPMCVAYAICVGQCMVQDVGINLVAGECNNFGESAKSCALSCLLGPLGRLGKMVKRAGKGLGKKAADAAGDCANSFPPGTLVHIKPRQLGTDVADAARHGQSELIKISELNVGDEVLAVAEWKEKGQADGIDQRFSYEKITDVYTSYKEQSLVHLTLANGKTISSTAGHPFRTKLGWRDATTIKRGDQVEIIAGSADNKQSFQKVIAISTERETLQVYNLEVANAHTFMVGEDGAVVHNGFGSYTCHFGNGMRYHGKGDLKRAKESAAQKAKDYGTTTKQIDHKPELNNRDSYKSEHVRLSNDGGPRKGVTNNYNKINSPGKKY
jgi:RHS repeat-associated protein